MSPHSYKLCAEVGALDFRGGNKKTPGIRAKRRVGFGCAERLANSATLIFVYYLG